jgi:hypothetical protein
LTYVTNKNAKEGPPNILKWDAPGRLAMTSHAIKARLRGRRKETKTPWWEQMGLVFRYQDAENYYGLMLRRQNGERELFSVANGSKRRIKRDMFPYVSGRDQEVDIYCYDGLIILQMDGRVLFSTKDRREPSTGHLGAYNLTFKGGLLDDIRVYRIADE